MNNAQAVVHDWISRCESGCDFQSDNGKFQFLGIDQLQRKLNVPLWVTVAKLKRSLAGRRGRQGFVIRQQDEAQVGIVSRTLAVELDGSLQTSFCPNIVVLLMDDDAQTMPGPSVVRGYLHGFCEKLLSLRQAPALQVLDGGGHFRIHSDKSRLVRRFGLQPLMACLGTLLVQPPFRTSILRHV